MPTPPPLNPDIQSVSTREPSRFWTSAFAAVMLVMVLIFLGGAYFIIRPRILQIKEVQAQTQQRMTQLEQQQRYLQSLQRSLAASEVIDEEALRKIDRALPSSVQTTSLLLQLTRAAERSSVRIDSVNIAQPTNTAVEEAGVNTESPSHLTNIDIALTVRAQRYVDLKRFLADLESSLQIMDVLNLGFGSLVGEGASYQLQLRTYIYPLASTSTTAMPTP